METGVAEPRECAFRCGAGCERSGRHANCDQGAGGSAFTFLGESMLRSITDNGGINALTQGRRREIELDPQA